MARDWTFRDAGRLPLPLRLLNAAGRLAPGAATLDPDPMIDKAIANTGLDDFGGDEWREGLEVLCDSSMREADGHTFARITQKAMYTGLLEKRLRLVQWAKDYPSVREERITAPFVVLGLPRTGTTLLSHLMDLDPRARSLTGWESSALVPPPTLATRAEDPRLAEEIKRAEALPKLMPPAPAMHPFGATLPTECVTLHMLDFRSLGFETQVLAPTYGSWLEQCDMRSAYAIHELALQTLQSTIPTGHWSLKTPNHLWALDALLERYPDARLVWTHRDPKKVVPSVASLNTAFYRTWSNNADPVATGRAWAHKLLLAVSRGMEHDDAQEGKAWCHHLQYEDLMKDPVEAVRGIYAHFGRDLDPLHEKRMRVWMATRPQDTFGRHRYAMRDFGFTPEGLDEMFADYCERFDVPSETRS
jgi:hypothetical protein